jgi:hypothetical protein
MINDQEAEKLVTLTLDAAGLPVPDIDPVPVRRGKQRVRWCAEFEFTIEIEGYTDLKYAKGGKGCAHRADTGVFEKEGEYKYTIRANGQENDPVLDVRP